MTMFKKKRINVVEVRGEFVKTVGYQKGVDVIQFHGVDDVIFLCDLHLDIPVDFVHRIRKHVIKGQMAFAPLVMKLECGKSPLDPKGLWDFNGFGLLGISKYDWDRIGGMNTEEFTSKWGGEDWEIIDRIVQAGLLVVRQRIPYLYHYYHTKNGLWKGGISRLMDVM